MKSSMKIGNMDVILREVKQERVTGGQYCTEIIVTADKNLPMEELVISECKIEELNGKRLYIGRTSPASTHNAKYLLIVRGAMPKLTGKYFRSKCPDDK